MSIEYRNYVIHRRERAEESRLDFYEVREAFGIAPERLEKLNELIEKLDAVLQDYLAGDPDNMDQSRLVRNELSKVDRYLYKIFRAMSQQYDLYESYRAERGWPLVERPVSRRLHPVRHIETQICDDRTILLTWDRDKNDVDVVFRVEKSCNGRDWTVVARTQASSLMVSNCPSGEPALFRIVATRHSDFSITAALTPIYGAQSLAVRAA